MPRLGSYASPPHGVGAEKVETSAIALEPLTESGESPGGREFLRQQLDTAAPRHAALVHDVDVSTPMMPTRPRKGRPCQDGLDSIGFAQGFDIDEMARAVPHRTLPVEFRTPDRQLPLELPEARNGAQLDAFLPRRCAHGAEGLSRSRVQEAVRFRHVLDVADAPSRQFAGSEHFHPNSMGNRPTFRVIHRSTGSPEDGRRVISVGNIPWGPRARP